MTKQWLTLPSEMQIRQNLTWTEMNTKDLDG